MDNIRDRFRQAPAAPPRRPLTAIHTTPRRAGPAKPKSQPITRRAGRRLLAVLTPHLRQAGRFSLRHKKVTAIALLVTSLAVFGIVRLTGQPASAAQTAADSTFQANTSGVLQKGTPKYTTFLPAARDISQLGGWTRVSPPNKNPVYAYTDQLDGIDVSVSQQPLPASFQPDVADQVAELAKNFGASDSFSVGSDKVYIGTSAKGPQSLIMVRQNTLILIKSSAPLATDKWVTYLSALR